MALVYQATAKIYYHGVLAYAIGDRVPDANVTLYGYDTLNLVQQVTVADPAAPMPGVDLTTQAEFDAWKTTASSTYAAAPAKGVVCFTWDDGNPSWPAVKALADARNQHHTFFVTSDFIDAVNKTTVAVVASLPLTGHEVGAHSKTHADLTGIGTAPARVVEYDTPVTALEALVGAGQVNSFAYPLGARNATTDTEQYLRAGRIFATGYAVPSVIPMADRDGRYLYGRFGWLAANQATVLDLIRLAATQPVVVVIYAHDPGNAGGSFPNDPSLAQVTEALDLAASLGVRCTTVREALPAANLVVNGGFENGLAGWTLPLGMQNGLVEAATDTPVAGLPGTKSLHIQALVAASGTINVEQAIPVKQGVPYKMTCRTRVANLVGANVQFNVAQLDYAGAKTDTITTISANEAWTARNRAITLAATTVQLLLQFTVPTGIVADFYVDHIDLRPTHFGSYG